jgi:Zn-dependent protease
MIIGSLLGVRIRIHPSWLIIFFLLVASLFSWVQEPGRYSLSPGPGLIAAVAVTLLFFAAVVAHELAHALVARWRGVVVKEISLFVFGGAAAMSQEPRSALSEGLIAAAGPALSGLVGGVFLTLSWLLRDATGDVLLVAYWIAYMLGMSNLLLAAFNLIPGFPMDGGRILRAVAWGVTKDFVRATRVASVVGRSFAYLLMFLGFVMALRGSLFSGLWLVLIGWFLNQAAKGSYNHLRLEQLVEGMHVGDALEREFAVVGPNLTLDTLIEQHELRGDSAVYAVTEGGDLVGAIDVGEVARIPRKQWPTTRVIDVMRSGPQMVTFTEPQPLMDVVTRFEQTGLNAFPVVDTTDPRRLLGMVTRVAVLKLMRSRAARSSGAGIR